MSGCGANMGFEELHQARFGGTVRAAMEEAGECELATAAELMFFKGAPLAHVVDYCEHMRMENISRRNMEMSRRMGRLRPTHRGSIFRSWEAA